MTESHKDTELKTIDTDMSLDKLKYSNLSDEQLEELLVYMNSKRHTPNTHPFNDQFVELRKKLEAEGYGHGGIHDEYTDMNDYLYHDDESWKTDEDPIMRYIYLDLLTKMDTIPQDIELYRTDRDFDYEVGKPFTHKGFLATGSDLPHWLSMAHNITNPNASETEWEKDDYGVISNEYGKGGVLLSLHLKDDVKGTLGFIDELIDNHPDIALEPGTQIIPTSITERTIGGKTIKFIEADVHPGEHNLDERLKELKESDIKEWAEDLHPKSNIPETYATKYIDLHNKYLNKKDTSIPKINKREIAKQVIAQELANIKEDQSIYNKAKQPKTKLPKAK